MSKLFFHEVYDLLVEAAGASNTYRDDFIAYFAREAGGSREWSFRGSLGSGGKLYLSHGRLYVGCYSEDSTPDRETLIAGLNRILELRMEVAAAKEECRRLREGLALAQGRRPPSWEGRVTVVFRRKDAEKLLDGEVSLHATNCIELALKRTA